MNINVLSVMAEYDEKAESYGRESTLSTHEKHQERISTFSNLDELNSRRKRTKNETKIGDQRTIVDYIGFYDMTQKKMDEELSTGTHYHNDPREYSVKLPRRHSSEVGELYTGDLKDEKVPVLIKK